MAIDKNKLLQAERKIWALQYLGGQCNVCGKSENLEFDHIDPKSKFFSISPHLKGNIDKLKLELDKCQLLCSKHHREKSSLESNANRTHGKQWMAIHFNCQCKLCLDYKNDFNLKRRQKRNSNRNNNPRVCGTYRMYKHGCRCAECKKANNTYMKQLRDKHGS